MYVADIGRIGIIESTIKFQNNASNIASNPYIFSLTKSPALVPLKNEYTPVKK